jgi:hypothetical protein
MSGIIPISSGHYLIINHNVSRGRMRAAERLPSGIMLSNFTTICLQIGQWV